MAIMADQDDPACKFVDRLDQRLPAVDIQVVGGFVQHQDLGFSRTQQREGQSRLLAAGKLARRQFSAVLAEAETAEMGAEPLRALFWEPRCQMVESRVFRAEILDLVLRKEADFELGRPDDVALHRL